MSDRRVVVTGIGAITPLGKTAAEFWEGLTSGRNGVHTIENFDTTDYPTKFGAQIPNYDESDYFDRKESRRLDKVCQYALIAAEEATKDSGLDLDAVDKNEVGVIAGTGIGGMITFYEQSVELYKHGPRGVSPFFIPKLIPDMVPGQISIRWGFKGPNFAAVSACASGSHNIGLAYDAICHDQCKIVVSGGAEAPVSKVGLAAFGAMRAMSTRNEEPEKASRPFDKGRDGFVLGEGAGMLILEEYEHAKARDARIYGEIIGYGFSADAHHITAPDPEGEGVILALNRALDSAGLRPEEIDHVNMHGTSTPLGDIAETNSLKKFFGEHAYKINFNSTKSMTGHTLGAAGAIESLATLLAIYNGVIPPTINFENPDPDCDLNYTFNQSENRNITYALNNAFGFGGHNTSLVFKKFDE
jgi:3-oxoacyl-[acyl-carrier-protein] synthase II